MGWNGAGVFNRLYSWVADAAAGIDITASRMDADTNDITANGLGNCLTRDGQGIASANLPMGGYRHTGVGAGVALTDYAALSQIQSGAVTWVAGGGSADAITATYAPAVAALTDGLVLSFRATAANTTTTPTFAPNGLPARTITKGGGTALLVGDIIGSLAEYWARYNSANTRWELLNPTYPGPTTGTGSAVRQTAAAVGGVWTAAATWTLPAFTLGGAVTATGQTITGGTFSGITLSGTASGSNTIPVAMLQNPAAFTVLGNNTSGAAAVTANGSASFTPTDQSGDSLTFATIAIRTFQIGPMVWVYGRFDFPNTTGSTHNVKVSLPGTPINSNVASTPSITAMGSAVSSNSILFGLPAAGTPTMSFNYGTTGAAVTNLQMSGLTYFMNSLFPLA